MSGYLHKSAAIGMLLVIMGCGGSGDSTSPTANEPTTPPTAPPVTPPTPTEPVTLDPIVAMPRIIDVTQLTTEAKHYERVEFAVDLDANFDNPFDVRQVDLMATFSGPDNQQLRIPGFWAGDNGWRIRFSPPAEGQWQAAVRVTDSRGQSASVEMNFAVDGSDRSGWILAGDQVDPSYSSRYLAYHDGTAFYGVGHGDAFAITSFQRYESQIQDLISEMADAGENYIIYWPSFSFSIIGRRFDNYQQDIAEILDRFIQQMEQNDLHLIYTIWDHSYIRDANHPWGDDRWLRNGFNRLGSVTDFFEDEEAWQWQQNFYRYLIARWSYSSAIGMWQTVSEIDGSSAFANSNPWHQQVNQYFVDNDPYRHPTTASMSGDRTWDIGHAVMDVPQVHIYNDLLNRQNSAQGLVIETAEVIAGYTADMWELEAKPNWVGEFGVLNDNGFDNHYPELFHNAIWAALANGAAMTPAEWNDDNRWQIMTPEMRTHMRHFANFVADIPLVEWSPELLSVRAAGQNFRAWGFTAPQGTVIWGLDTSHRGRTIAEIRTLRSSREGVQLALTGLANGRYQVSPYNTWTGQTLVSYEVLCDGANLSCELPLPAFESDIALRLTPLF